MTDHHLLFLIVKYRIVDPVSVIKKGIRERVHQGFAWIDNIPMGEIMDGGKGQLILLVPWKCLLLVCENGVI